MAKAEGDFFGSDLLPGTADGSGAPTNADAGSASASSGSGRRMPVVRTRSGRRIEFDATHLAASIERARRAAGHDDAALSAEVADIAAFALASRLEAFGEGGGARAKSPDQRVADTRTVPVDEIGTLVERVLVELGLARVAKEYILARDRKSRTREALGDRRHSVVGGGQHRLPTVRSAAGAAPFDSRRIGAALVEEAGLPLDEAARVAERVAETLAGTELRTVSTALIRELVSNELLGLGLQDALKRHEAVGVPRHDLQRDFDTAVAPRAEARAVPSGRHERLVAPRFEDLATASLLGRWALEDILPAGCAEAHRSAELHVIALETPHRSLTRSVPVDLLGSGIRTTRSNAFDLVRQVGRLAADVSHGVILEDVADVLSGLASTGNGDRVAPDVAVVDLVFSLGGVAAALRRDIGVARFGGRGGVACGRLVRAIDTATRTGGVSLRAHATLAEIEAAVLHTGPEFAADTRTADAVENLLATGHLVPVWAPSGQRWVGPGCLRRRGEKGGLAVGAAIALNLPRLARRAGPWREDVFLGLLKDLVVTAMEALEALSRARGRAREVQGEFLAARVVSVIVPVGLAESLRILGDGVARTDQGQRILGALHDVVRRVGEASGLDVRPTAAFGEAASRRFARADSRLSGPGQPRLFSDLPRPEHERVAAYTSGFGSLAVAQVGPITAPGMAPVGEPLMDAVRRPGDLATVLGTLPAGQLLPPSGAGDLDRIVSDGASARRSRGHASEAPGDAEHRSGADFGTESTAARRAMALAALCEDRPRFAAWSRFARMRESGEAQETPSAVDTLF